MIKMLKKMNYIFGKKQKIQLVLLFVVILIGAVMEMFGISAMIPFISAIMLPEKFMSNKYVQIINSWLHFESAQQLLILMSMAIMLIYVLKNIYLLFMNYTQYKFIFSNQRKLSKEMLSRYMEEPYLFHVSHNSAELRNNISTDVDTFFVTITTILQFCTEIILTLSIIAFLLYTDKSITIGVTLMMLFFMLFFLKLYKPKVREYGDKRRKYSIGMAKWLDQSLGGIKEIKIINKEDFFVNNYAIAHGQYTESRRKYTFCTAIPKPVLETVCIIGIFSVIALKISRGVDSEYFVTTLSVFVLAAYKLLPSVSKIVAYLSTIMFNKSSIDALYKDIVELEQLQHDSNVKRRENNEIITLKKEIKIDNLSFKYPHTDSYVLQNVNFIIPKNKSVAFIGASGAGKTTLADIILGVLEPTEGRILVDDVDIYANMDAWHQNLGYIPQSIYLMDDTIRKNIAFGLSDDEIEEQRIWQAIEDAQLKEFIESLDYGLDTKIGERGVRLSGGQRQRIGIARALYYNPDILVLDEATSALDNETEKAVMESIDNLTGKKTLIIIAHRLTTIENCDIKYEVRDGSVKIKEDL